MGKRCYMREVHLQLPFITIFILVAKGKKEVNRLKEAVEWNLACARMALFWTAYFLESWGFSLLNINIFFNCFEGTSSCSLLFLWTHNVESISKLLRWTCQAGFHPELLRLLYSLPGALVLGVQGSVLPGPALWDCNRFLAFPLPGFTFLHHMSQLADVFFT